jgi:uncharacterized protein (TIGR03382 family)
MSSGSIVQFVVPTPGGLTMAAMALAFGARRRR